MRRLAEALGGLSPPGDGTLDGSGGALPNRTDGLGKVQWICSKKEIFELFHLNMRKEHNFLLSESFTQ